ncbi:efflux RND transporter periplasmic adaptor subunit [Gracilimonas sediminicola]|uniref:Efflux RND transporter periplasmic adaptor subunit n=1 Tax=Gracilimonas sediminicola TaxID=2952158 RepID=A0A9X2L604_9BACT|nr:efflux RND transporter periplasmic adaptor subunit [Gracilimonas sediminicola]MCP9293018.1 efflux RND transporter periplasmic adaptor subunit [Gracilimonas sediminicola]
MKQLIPLLILSTSLLMMGCGGGGDEGHSHGEDSDHIHEQPAQQAQEDDSHSHDGEDAHSHGEDAQLEGAGVITKWTDKTELFMEYPELIVGQEATFAVHLTRLSDFQPISESEVQFVFSSERGNEGSLTETEVQIPGIYGPDVIFDRAGRYDLTIIIQGMVDDTLQVNGIPVYASAEEVPAAHEEDDPNLISFLKEQQWNIPFATQKVGRRTLSETVDAHGELKPVKSMEVTVSAPFSGIILSSANQSLPVEGQNISKGISLLQLNPSIQSADGENYAQQFINAQSQLSLAHKNLERSKRLFEKEAIPEVELERARIEYRQALTEFQTINEIAQIDTSKVDTYGDSESSYGFAMKAPISGIIVDSYVQPGMQVKAGEALFKLADMSKMWLSVHVPAAERKAIQNPGEAVFYVQGNDKMYNMEEVNGRLLSTGKQVEPQTRTLSLIYEIDNQEGLHSGLFVTAEIDTDQKENVVAIPESALIEEEGNFVVYVHVAGESFEKRAITTGIRNRGWVEVTSSLEEGEHVVTTNAYQVKLASLSSEAPSHGHSH